MITRPPKILLIKSDISELIKVELFLLDILKEHNLSEKYFNKIFLCLSEAVLNAIRHGHKDDRNKDVVVCVDYYEREMKIMVEDEGDGFDVSKIEDPKKGSNLKNESGRGIFIIKNLSNKLEYNEKGNCIQFNIDCK